MSFFLAALSACMQVQITVVPYTPVGQAMQWRTSRYGASGWPRAVLGNNNVHYVWLREKPAWVVVSLKRHAVSVPDCRDVLAQHGAMSPASQLKRKLYDQVWCAH